MPNTEQIEHWDGVGGEHWAAHAERYDTLLLGYGARIVERVAPQPGERVLDIGCGNGALSLLVAPRAGSVVGVDISGPMLAEAARRAQAAGVPNVAFEKGDAQVFPFEAGGFDAAVSRFGVMFFDDPGAAFANIGRALKPGGRVVFTVWRQAVENEWITVPARAALAHVPMPPMVADPTAPGPFALADAERVRSLLAAAGFVDVDCEAAREVVTYGATVEEAVELMQGTEMSRTLLKDADEATAARAWEAIAEALRPYESAEGVRLAGSAWVVTASVPTA